MSSPKGLDMDSALLEDKNMSSLRGAREREAYQRLVNEQPEKVIQEWWLRIRAECGVADHMPFDAMSYGEKTLAKKWEKHGTLRRMWIMLATLHTELHHGRPQVGQAKLVQMLKALARATRADGKWEGAWEFTHLPEPDEVAGGVGADKKAATGRWIGEREATHKAVKQ
jgi:hypothetical protein